MYIGVVQPCFPQTRPSVALGTRRTQTPRHCWLSCKLLAADSMGTEGVPEHVGEGGPSSAHSPGLCLVSRCSRLLPPARGPPCPLLGCAGPSPRSPAAAAGALGHSSAHSSERRGPSRLRPGQARRPFSAHPIFSFLDNKLYLITSVISPYVPGRTLSLANDGKTRQSS